MELALYYEGININFCDCTRSLERIGRKPWPWRWPTVSNSAKTLLGSKFNFSTFFIFPYSYSTVIHTVKIRNVFSSSGVHQVLRACWLHPVQEHHAWISMVGSWKKCKIFIRPQSSSHHRNCNNQIDIQVNARFRSRATRFLVTTSLRLTQNMTA